MTLGEKLRNLRVKTQKTLWEQSKIFKVPMNTLYRWEHDLASPSRTELKMMADYFGVPLDWLMSDGASTSLQTSLATGSGQNILCAFRKPDDTTRYEVIGYVLPKKR